jgi:hypothetical protein
MWPPALAAMTCFKLTPVPAACPLDATPAPTIQANVTTCTNGAGTTCDGICGSASAASYKDSSGAAKMGYCVCIAGKFQCASAAEWAPQ